MWVWREPGVPGCQRHLSLCTDACWASTHPPLVTLRGFQGHTLLLTGRLGPHGTPCDVWTSSKDGKFWRGYPRPSFIFLWYLLNPGLSQLFSSDTWGYLITNREETLFFVLSSNHQRSLDFFTIPHQVEFASNFNIPLSPHISLWGARSSLLAVPRLTPLLHPPWQQRAQDCLDTQRDGDSRGKHWQGWEAPLIFYKSSRFKILLLLSTKRMTMWK